jgi:hypothetical protein
MELDGKKIDEAGHGNGAILRTLEMRTWVLSICIFST